MVVNAGQGYDNDPVQDGPFGFKRPEQWAFHQPNGLAANSSKALFRPTCDQPAPTALKNRTTDSIPDES